VLNNPYQSSVAKNSAVGGSRVKSLPPGAPQAFPTYKYGGINSGMGGGFDSGGGSYGAGEQSLQGVQGSVGSSHGNNDYRLPVIQSR
jgi:hypothetical protein